MNLKNRIVYLSNRWPSEAAAVALILGHVSLVVLLLLLPRGPDFIASERETLLQTIRRLESRSRGGEMLAARGRSKAMPMIKMPGFGATPPVCLFVGIFLLHLDCTAMFVNM